MTEDVRTSLSAQAESLGLAFKFKRAVKARCPSNLTELKTSCNIEWKKKNPSNKK